MEGSTKTIRTLWIWVPISMILVLVVNGRFFATSYCKPPCDGIGGAVKRHGAKWILRRPLNNQTLNYKAMLDLCENEMMSLKFFGICKVSMISTENLEIEKWYEGGYIVPVTLSNYHWVPLPSSRLSDKLSSEDESYVNIHDFMFLLFLK